jgi:spore coat protein U-like protein
MRITQWIFLLGMLLNSFSWASCSVTPPIAALGQYDPATGSSVRGIFNLQITCSEITSFTVTAGPSQNTGTISHRQLRGENPTSLLNYQLCTDDNWGGPCNKVFGSPPNGEAISGMISRPGSSVLVKFWALVYGDQPAMPGWHEDFIVITVSP